MPHRKQYFENKWLIARRFNVEDQVHIHRPSTYMIPRKKKILVYVLTAGNLLLAAKTITPHHWEFLLEILTGGETEWPGWSWRQTSGRESGPVKRQKNTGQEKWWWQHLFWWGITVGWSCFFTLYLLLYSVMRKFTTDLANIHVRTLCCKVFHDNAPAHFFSPSEGNLVEVLLDHQGVSALQCCWAPMTSLCFLIFKSFWMAPIFFFQLKMWKGPFWHV